MNPCRPTRLVLAAALCAALFSAAACAAATPAPTAAPTATPDLPRVTAAQLDRQEVPRYESLEMAVTLEAKYANPYDAREVSLDAVFTGPDGKIMQVPGFWDGTESWKVRFTPSAAGAWAYSLTVTDSRGPSRPLEGSFTTVDSALHGWLQVGSWVNPEYSSRYLVHQDGTPFYGVGHCDTNNLMADGFSAQSGVALFDNMKAAGENFVVWWPNWSASPILNSHKEYSVPNMNMLDIMVKDAQKKGVFVIWTVWEHNLLRDETHPWGNYKWGSNGFSQLGGVDTFFNDAESWAWQENLYRYIIARWGYSPAIGLWATVSEINGTSAGDQLNPWHKKVNDYFTAHDPYRHPTTASMSGDVDWPEGFAVMDAPQVHVYDLPDAVRAAETIARWTRVMWDQAAKPNWIGEFGVRADQFYPEMFHYSIWAALASGSAMTPAEWNDRGDFGKMSPEMSADMLRLSQFVADLPLAVWNPAPLPLTISDPLVRGWGLAGKAGGLFWVQDFSQEGRKFAEERAGLATRSGVTVDLTGLAAGTYIVRPFDTWKGAYLESFEVTCEAEKACRIALPDFFSDMAFRLNLK